MGELHLDVLVDRMVREFRVAANVGKPQVSTARRSAGRPTATAASCARRRQGPVRPRRDQDRAAREGRGYEFVDKVVGGSIPREYIKPIDAGIREALETGIYAGFPAVDIR
jgi:elongation factor G